MIYIVCASGCIALFDDELQLWEHPELQQIPAPVGGIVNIKAVLDQARQHRLAESRATFQLPHQSNGVILRIPDESGRIAIFDPSSGALLAIKPEGFGRVLRVLHSDLLMPLPWGTYLTGFLGITLVFLVLTGVFVHRRFYLEMFTLRTGRSWRLSWSDIHKLAGTWGMAFLGMMGFTGSILGLAALLLLQTAIVAHRGDAAQAFSELLGAPSVASGKPAPLGATEKMLSPEIGGEPFIPRFITIAHIGDENATVTIEGERPDYLSNTDRKVFSREAELLELPRGVYNGAGWRTYSALLPLHFGDFGGPALKFVYLLLGLAACLMPVSGILLWLDRHRRDQTFSRGHFLMRGVTAGVTIGLPIAFATLFLATRLAPDWMAKQGNATAALLVVWLTVICWAVLRATKPYTERRLFWLAGALLVLVVPVNQWVTGDSLLVAMGRPLSTSHVVDGVMLAIGLGVLMTTRRRQQR